MSPAVEADGISKVYGNLVAVDGLSLTVDTAEILGVLGPNGAGKTTAIRVLTTVLAPTRGTFSVAGVSQARPAEIRRRIGVLPESAGYPEQQTGEEYLRYHARLYGHDRASARAVAASLLCEVGLSDRSRARIASFSRGMRQRLGIARALVNEPRVVFLDEPTLGLDPAGQRQVIGLVRRLARERDATVLLSTHLLAEVEEICSRVLILNGGRLVAEGTVSEIVRRAAAPRTARVQVVPERAGEAAAALERGLGPGSVTAVTTLPGALDVALDSTTPENAVIRALVECDIPVQGFELEGARLSDAFLAMTGEGSLDV